MILTGASRHWLPRHSLTNSVHVFHVEVLSTAVSLSLASLELLPPKGYLLSAGGLNCDLRQNLTECFCTSSVSKEARGEETGSSGTGITDSCEPMCGCWEANPSPLQEYQEHLTFEPSLQPKDRTAPLGSFAGIRSEYRGSGSYLLPGSRPILNQSAFWLLI